jgi:hypothetical protein
MAAESELQCNFREGCSRIFGKYLKRGQEAEALEVAVDR